MANTTIEGDIAATLLARLATFSHSPAIDIAWPGIHFEPTDGETYFDAQVYQNKTETRAVTMAGADHYKGFLQVAVMYPLSLGAGIIAPTEIAGDVITHFARGTVLTGDIITVRIIERGWVSPAMTDGDRIRVPVTIPYECFAAP